MQRQASWTRARRPKENFFFQSGSSSTTQISFLTGLCVSPNSCERVEQRHWQPPLSRHGISLLQAKKICHPTEREQERRGGKHFKCRHSAQQKAMKCKCTQAALWKVFTRSRGELREAATTETGSKCVYTMCVYERNGRRWSHLLRCSLQTDTPSLFALMCGMCTLVARTTAADWRKITNRFC